MRGIFLVFIFAIYSMGSFAQTNPVICNSGFESSLTNWVSNDNGGAVAYSDETTDVYAGSISLKASVNTAATWENRIESCDFDIEEGFKYTLKFMAKTVSGTAANIQIIIKDPSNANLISNVTEVSGTEWREYSFSYDAEYNETVHLRVSFQNVAEYLIDDITVEETYLYFDNGDFELGINQDWKLVEGTGQTAIYSEANGGDVYSGSIAAEVEITSNPSAYSEIRLRTDSVGVYNQEAELTLVVYGKSDIETSAFKFAATFYDATGTQIGASVFSGVKDLSSEYVRRSYTVSVPSNMVVFVAELRFGNFKDTYYFDKFSYNFSPIITSASAVSMPENSSAVITVEARDCDPGDTKAFSISGGDDSNLFTIDEATGELTFVKAPDFENPADTDTNNEYIVELTVTDSRGHTDVQTLTVTVTDLIKKELRITEVNSHALDNVTWIELYNQSSTPIDLTGISLSFYHVDASVTVKNLSGTIGADDYYVITRNLDAFLAEYEFAADLQFGNMFLQTSNGVGLSLQEGTDTLDKFNNVPKLDETINDNHSYIRFEYYNDGTDLANHWRIIGKDVSGTPGAENENITWYAHANGNWTNFACWTLDSLGVFVNPHSETPQFCSSDSVVIKSDIVISVDADNVSTEKLHVLGTVNFLQTTGHTFTDITGTGKIIVTGNNLPNNINSDFFTSAGGTIEFAGTGNYWILTDYTKFNNLVLSNTANITMANKDLELNNLEINGSTLINNSSRIITVKNDITLNSGSIVMNSGSLLLNGTVQQNISGAVGFTGANSLYNIEVNNGNGVLLSTPVSVTNSLTLNGGTITSDAVNYIELGASATLSYLPNCFINGPFVRKLATTAATTLDFPVGKSSAMHRAELTVEQDATTETSYTVEYLANAPSAFTKPAGIHHVSTVGHWRISKGAGSIINSGAVNLHYLVSDAVDNATDLRVVKDNGVSDWINLGGTGTGAPSGSILSAINFTSFSEFALASFSSDNPLPIELTEFTALEKSSAIELNWTTKSEINNDYFEVQKSTDAISFKSIGMVDGKGNSSSNINYSYTDNNPQTGTNYYRLKQVDYDGKVEFHKTISIAYESTNRNSMQSDFDICIAPNPYNSGRLFMKLANAETQSSLNVTIVNINGQQLFNGTVKVPFSKKINIVPQLINELTKGVYYIRVNSNSEIRNSKFIVE